MDAAEAESDLRTAEQVDNHADARTRCQAISKYQQCVEKSIKGVGEMKRVRYCAGLMVRRLRQILGALDLLYP